MAKRTGGRSRPSKGKGNTGDTTWDEDPIIVDSGNKDNRAYQIARNTWSIDGKEGTSIVLSRGFYTDKGEFRTAKGKSVSFDSEESVEFFEQILGAIEEKAELSELKE